MSSTIRTTEGPGQVKFEKVLWRKQPFCDNYVAPTFLSDLQTNSQVVLPSFATLVLASLRISTRFLSVMLFALLFVHLHLRTLDSELLLLAVIVAFIALSVESWYRGDAAQGTSKRRRAVGGLLTKLILGLVLLAVSPVLRTLTESTTSDSIWALSVVLFSLHLVLADYSRAPEERKLSETLSFNAAISASVVLASRLKTDSDTFTLLALAVVLFAPHPTRHPTSTEGKGRREVVGFAMVYTLTMVTAGWFKREEEWVGRVCTWVNVAVVFVSVVCPWWIVKAQRWKMQIRGPWDPATPVLSR